MIKNKILERFPARDVKLLFFAAILILPLVFHNRAQTSAPASFVEQAKLLANDGASQDNLGFSVAISGDTAIVGAPRNSGGTGLQNRGAAYIYVRTGTTWTQQQKLTPSDGAANDQFGYSVAIWGNTAIVGRQNTTTGVNRADGKVYVFTRTGTIWTETQTIVSSDLAQGDLFGNALAFENDTLVVGALNKNSGNNFFQGAAYVFTRNGAGGNFTQEAKLTASDGAASDFFGYSVAVSGDTAVIGSVQAPLSGIGKAYVFVRNGSSWTQQQKLTASDGAAGDAFGFSVGVSGDYAIIGARLDDNGQIGDQGSAYIFARSGSVWTEQQKLLGVELTQRNDQFGYAVAIKGNTAVVGSPAHEIVSSIANHGAVYVFNREGTVWTRTQKLIHKDPAPDALGQAVAFDGNSILAGAPSKNSARGAAYVFNSIQTNGQFKLVPPEVFINPLFGLSLGFSDDTAAIGSNLGTYIYTRSGSSWTFTQKLNLISENNNATNITPGSSIAISGDTMFVGARGARINSVNLRGVVLVYTRSNGVWTEQQRLIASDGAAGDQFGSSIAVSGNTLVVGAENDAGGANNNQGSAYIFVYDGATWTEQQKITAADAAANDHFGFDVAIAGDTVAVSATNKTIDGNTERGAVYVFTRTGTTWTQQARLIASDGATSSRFGESVAIENDTIVVGAPQQQIGQNGLQGAAYVFNRTNGAWTETQKLFDPAGSSVDFFGRDVAISGDRLFVGASNTHCGDMFGCGSIYAYTRNNQMWQKRGELFAFDANGGDANGWKIAISGNYLATTALSGDNYGVNGSGAGYIFDLTQVRFGSPEFDFDGDGKADLSVFRGGNWYVQESATNQFRAVQFGATGDRIAPADYDGDGKTDYAVYRGGVWYVLGSQTGFSAVSFGTADDIPIPGDFDGDGKADISVFRPSNGTWYRLNSSNNQFIAVAFGTIGDKPVIGDFDGDGKSDIAVFRPSSGSWYRLNSSDNQFVAVQFGASGDLPVAADYDGDGKTDIAVFRNGVWYRLNSSDGNFVAVSWGNPADKPVPADFDGDGKADIAVFRNGVWFVLQSSSNSFRSESFGTTGDAPIPNAFVQ